MHGKIICHPCTLPLRSVFRNTQGPSLYLPCFVPSDECTYPVSRPWFNSHSGGIFSYHCVQKGAFLCIPMVDHPIFAQGKDLSRHILIGCDGHHWFLVFLQDMQDPAFHQAEDGDGAIFPSNRQANVAVGMLLGILFGASDEAAAHQLSTLHVFRFDMYVLCHHVEVAFEVLVVVYVSLVSSHDGDQVAARAFGVCHLCHRTSMAFLHHCAQAHALPVRVAIHQAHRHNAFTTVRCLVILSFPRLRHHSMDRVRRTPGSLLTWFWTERDGIGIVRHSIPAVR
mmetsp:Transcript_10797/g.66695  ORF Transcript_10797/g.66695 Transcript_10797/m.66695 type:complete len:282 (+) Transcript_10797:2323-3168(+)